MFFSLFDMIERHYHGNQPVATFMWLFACFSPFPPHMYTLRSQWDLKEGKRNIAAFWSLAQVWTVFQEMKKILLYSVTYFVFAIFWLYVLYLASLQNATDTQHKCTHTQFACWWNIKAPHTQYRFKDTLMHSHARTFTLRCTHCWRVSLSICDINDNKPPFHTMNCLCRGTVC